MDEQEAKKLLKERYEEFEIASTKASEQKDIMKQLKNEMMEILETSGLEYVLVPGSDSDLMKIEIATKVNEKIDKKVIADKLGIKVKELNDFENLVELIKEGQVTKEMLGEAKIKEEIEHFNAEVYKPEEE